MFKSFAFSHSLINKSTNPLGIIHPLGNCLRNRFFGGDTMNISNLQLNEATGKYIIASELSSDEIIQAAKKILNYRFKRGGVFTSPQAVYDYLDVYLKGLDHEVFYILYLDSQNRLIGKEILFTGTINCASVYPREIVKSVLDKNANAVILAHNHPSGIAEPSQADKAITNKIKNALSLIDVNVLDHIIVGERTISFAERGLI
jgi:DNA repair protein RadC